MLGYFAHTVYSLHMLRLAKQNNLYETFALKILM